MENTRPVTRVCAAVFTVNFLLFGVKLYIGLASNAISIFSDAINNLFDALSCLLAVGGIRLAVSAKSRAYPDGLGRAEDLAGFLMAVSTSCLLGSFERASMDGPLCIS